MNEFPFSPFSFIYNKPTYRIILHKITKTITIKTTRTQIPEPCDKDIASPIFPIVFLKVLRKPPTSLSYI